ALYRRARDGGIRQNFTGAQSNGESEQEQETLLQAAVKLDPNFVEAWALLGAVHGHLFSGNLDHSATRLAKAKAALDRAASLAPESPQVISRLGSYFRDCEHDYARAAEQFEKVARLQPNSAQTYHNLGQLQRTQGKWAEALANLRKATLLDPAFHGAALNLVLTFHQCRRFDDERAELRRMVTRWPERI